VRGTIGPRGLKKSVRPPDSDGDADGHMNPKSRAPIPLLSVQRLAPAFPGLPPVGPLLLRLSPLIALPTVNGASGGERLEREFFDRLPAFGALQIVDANVVHLSAFGSHLPPSDPFRTASLPAEAETR